MKKRYNTLHHEQSYLSMHNLLCTTEGCDAIIRRASEILPHDAAQQILTYISYEGRQKEILLYTPAEPEGYV